MIFDHPYNAEYLRLLLTDVQGLLPGVLGSRVGRPRRQGCPEEGQADLAGCVPEKAEGLVDGP